MSSKPPPYPDICGLEHLSDGAKYTIQISLFGRRTCGPHMSIRFELKHVNITKSQWKIYLYLMLTKKNQNRDLGRLKGWGVHMDNGCYRYHTTKISLCDSERQLKWQWVYCLWFSFECFQYCYTMLHHVHVFRDVYFSPRFLVHSLICQF